ncbi:MAG: hypothetical protein RIT45_500 [Pseudomonadota bacterium]
MPGMMTQRNAARWALLALLGSVAACSSDALVQGPDVGLDTLLGGDGGLADVDIAAPSDSDDGGAQSDATPDVAVADTEDAGIDAGTDADSEADSDADDADDADAGAAAADADALPIDPCLGVDCDDGAPCTSDACDPSTGTCLHTPASGAACDDGNACTTADLCVAGGCIGTALPAASCDDGNPCTDDGCAAATGCVHLPADATCTDGNPCTAPDVCVVGQCTPGSPTCACVTDADCAGAGATDPCVGALVCDKSGAKWTCKLETSGLPDCGGASNDPCKVGACDSKTGGCAMVAVADGTPCDADGTTCTLGDACQAGTCTAGPKLGCNDDNPCTVDACEPSAGCVHLAAPATCDADGDACTGPDACAAGTCVAGPSKSCDDGDPCTSDACDAATGACVHGAQGTDGLPCDADGSTCTPSDQCASGVCVKGTPLDCDDANPCTTDVCVSGTGCVHLAAPATCDADGDACTGPDACEGKSCTVGPAKSCDDGDACTADTCDKATGACGHLPIPGCGGKCTIDAHCDDGKACTTDACQQGACAHVAETGTACDDGEVCTTGDGCQNGVCVGAALPCSDGNPCTADPCVAGKGCVHLATAGSCDDGDACTVGDACQDGVCAAGASKDCDDGDACTTDVCVVGDGSCSHGKIAGCGGYCAKVADCDDDNVCTIDACAAGNCTWTAAPGPCEDGNACTLGDACSSGVCVAGKAKVCDDGDPCTVDGCNGSDGACTLAPAATGTACDDADACTGPDRCEFFAGPGSKVVCKGAKVGPNGKTPCDDGNDCTFDACDTKLGTCAHVALSGAACDDGAPCTVGTVCEGTVCKATAAIHVSTLAGDGQAGFADAAAGGGRVSGPFGVAAGDDGTVWIADTDNHRIRRVSPEGAVETLCGSGKAGLLDGKGAGSWWNAPTGLALRPDGSLAVADRENHAVRLCRADGSSATLSGNGVAGFVDGAAAAARWNRPHGVTSGPSEAALWVADTYNHRIRRIELGPTGAAVTVTTLAGSAAGYVDGKGAVARFTYPVGIARDGAGRLYVADQHNHRIRRVLPDGTVTTVAGSGAAGLLDGGSATARFYYPFGVAVDARGVLWIGDRYNHRLRTLEAGVVSTFVGSSPGFSDGTAATAKLNYPGGVAVDGLGRVVVADRNNHRVRRVVDARQPCLDEGRCVAAGFPGLQQPCKRCVPSKTQAALSAVADGGSCDDNDACTTADACKGGTCAGSALAGGAGTPCDDGDGCTADACEAAGGACLHEPIVGCGGNCANAGDCDDGNACTDDACTGGKCAVTANTQPCDDGKPCTWGDACKGGGCKAGDRTEVWNFSGTTQGMLDGAASSAKFAWIRAVATLPPGVDPGGAVALVADGGNHRIRALDAKGAASTRAGSTAGFSDGKGIAARFSTPVDLEVDDTGRAFVADTGNHRLRVLLGDGTVSTLAGGTAGYLDGKGTAARFSSPVGVATRGSGAVVYVAEAGNHRIRRVEADGTVTTLAGGSAGWLDGFGTTARFNSPYDVAVDAEGTLYVADLGNARIRRITPAGTVTTFAGSAAGYLDGPAGSARFNQPWKVAVGSSGAVYVADRYNHRIRRIRAGQVETFAGTGAQGLVDGDALSAARLRQPVALDVDRNGEVWFADYDNHRIRRARESKGACSIAGTCVAAGFRKPASPCERCDAALSDTGWSVAPDGSGCADGNACTVLETCSGGTCKGGPLDCDDGNACSADACDKAGACAYQRVPGCDAWCFGAADCADGDVCTDDACTGAVGSAGAPGAKAGTCSHVANTAPCDDGDACTAGDRCKAGACVSGTDVVVEALAGGAAGKVDGPGSVARFNQPHGLAVDANGTAWVADYANHALRRVEADGAVATVLGNGAGMVDGTFAVARFNAPADVALTGAKTLVVSEVGNHRVRRVDRDAKTVVTLAGSSAGYLDGKGTTARFNAPWGVDATAAGVVYVADYGNHRIRRVQTDGTVETVCGSSAGFLDGIGAAARLHGPIDVAVAASGLLYVAEYTGHRIRRVTPEGQTSLLAGSTAGAAGFADAKGGAARFQYPRNLDVDPLGGVVVADQNNHRIRHVAADGTASTLAGSGVAGMIDGLAAGARWNSPRGVTVGVDGRVLVADTANHRLRTVWASAASCVIAGRCWRAGVTDPKAPCSRCDRAQSAKNFSAGADGASCEDDLLCTATGACAGGACKVAPTSCDDGDACTTDACIAGSGACAHSKIFGCNGYCETDAHCDDGNPCTLGARCVASKCQQGDAIAVDTRAGSAAGYLDGPANAARMLSPRGVAPLRDDKGTLLGTLIADTGNHRLRLLTSAGELMTFAGKGSAGLVDGTGTAAWLHTPSGAAALPGGGVVFADRGSHTVRSVTSAGKVATLAGSGVAGYQDDAAPDARFNQPVDVAATATGIVLVADAANHRIRRITPEGLVLTLAGIGAGFADGDAAKARFNYPSGIDVDSDGRVFVADTGNHRLRRVDGDGNVVTIAGKGNAGWLDGSADKALLASPFDVAVDAAGRVWFADRGNHRIRRLAAGVVSTVAGNVAGYLDGASNARFSAPAGLWVHPGGELLVTDENNHRLRRVRDGGPSCAIGGACWAAGAADPAAPCKVCAPATATTAFSAAAEGAACLDGNPCSVQSACASGSCQATDAMVCNDNNKCSVDACDTKTGACTFAPIPGCKL